MHPDRVTLSLLGACVCWELDESSPMHASRLWHLSPWDCINSFNVNECHSCLLAPARLVEVVPRCELQLRHHVPSSSFQTTTSHSALFCTACCTTEALFQGWSWLAREGGATVGRMLPVLPSPLPMYIVFLVHTYLSSLYIYH